MNKLDTFKNYVNTINMEGEVWFDDIKISSNSYYVFFTDINTNRTIALFSKKYFMTVELVKGTEKTNLIQRLRQKVRKHSIHINKDTERLNAIAEVIEDFRQEKGYQISEYEFWLPHCLVNDKEVSTQLVAGSFGISRNLALEYLIQHDPIFKMLYDTDTKTYMGLPLMDTYELAQEYPLSENKKYLLEYRRLNRFLEK